MSDSEAVVGGRYRLISLIGTGGMGRVWLARDEVLRRDVAVKEVTFPPELSEDEQDELRQRMLREGRAAGRLSHPNVVAIYDVVHEGDRPWIVMEYVPSRSLYQVVKETGPLAPHRAAEVGLAVLAALRAAHRAGVLHRDVKPGNVLLARDRVVLTDFGLATFDGDGSITRSGLIMGSAQYISPERARDGVSTPESDLWSLGATLYAAVEGRSPYARPSSVATLTALATAPPDPARRAGPLRPVLDGLLQRNPRNRMRPEKAEKLLRRITEGDAGRGVVRRTATEETLTYTSRAPRWPAVAAGATGLVVVAVAAAALRPWAGDAPAGGPPETASPAGPALTAAMGVQACAEQAPSAETPVSPGLTAVPGGYAVPNANFTYHLDQAGFYLVVPLAWAHSTLGPLVCFRDPTSPKAIAVYVHGPIDGDPVGLLASQESRWREAAGLTDYERIALDPTYIGEGSADMEYTYQRDGVRMHGENRMVRLGGRVFTIYWLTTDLYWESDRTLLNGIQVSFGLLGDTAA